MFALSEEVHIDRQIYKYIPANIYVYLLYVYTYYSNRFSNTRNRWATEAIFYVVLRNIRTLSLHIYINCIFMCKSHQHVNKDTWSQLTN